MCVCVCVCFRCRRHMTHEMQIYTSLELRHIHSSLNPFCVILRMRQPKKTTTIIAHSFMERTQHKMKFTSIYNTHRETKASKKQRICKLCQIHFWLKDFGRHTGKWRHCDAAAVATAFVDAIVDTFTLQPKTLSIHLRMSTVILNEVQYRYIILYCCCRRRRLTLHKHRPYKISRFTSSLPHL